MRDHLSGPQWDHRTLGDLTWYGIHVVCRVCRHSGYPRPMDLAKRYQDRKRWGWRQFVTQFRCSRCGMTKADATAERLPRNQSKNRGWSKNR